MKVKTSDLENLGFITEIADILNRGNEVIIKKERDNIVLIEIKRDVKFKIHKDN